MMIRVVYSQHAFLMQQYGGISRYFCEIASVLSHNKAFDVSVVAPFHGNLHLKSSRDCKVLGNYFPYYFRGKGFLQRRSLNIFYWLTNKTDILHETYYSIEAFGDARRRVVTVYDMIHELFSDEFKNDTVTTIAKRAAIDRADHVICISESTRHDLIRLFGVDERKTSVVHLGFALNTDAPLQPAKLASGKPYLLYVGHRGGYKNFSRFCKAYSSSLIKNYFDLVAFGGGGFSVAEVADLASLGIADRVHQVGGADELLASYYCGASVFVYPSLYEGFGIPPLEAMNFGCPVACSNTSSIPEVVGDAAVLFDPDSEESMCVAIERLLESDELRAEMIRRGHVRVHHFSWDKCAAETAEIYKKICQAT